MFVWAASTCPGQIIPTSEVGTCRCSSSAAFQERPDTLGRRAGCSGEHCSSYRWYVCANNLLLLQGKLFVLSTGMAKRKIIVFCCQPTYKHVAGALWLQQQHTNGCYVGGVLPIISTKYLAQLFTLSVSSTAITCMYLSLHWHRQGPKPQSTQACWNKGSWMQNEFLHLAFLRKALVGGTELCMVGTWGREGILSHCSLHGRS